MSSKKENEDIPEGPYCYFGSRNPKYKSYQACKHWEWVSERVARCNLLNIQDDVPDHKGRTPMCLWDQVKECNLNCNGDEG